MPEITIDAQWATTTTGLLAVAAIVVALVASARVKFLTRVFGIGGVYGVHRALGLTAFGAVVLHVTFVLAQKWTNAMLLLPWSGSLASKAADLSTYALLFLIFSAIYRQRRNYDRWRHQHLILAGLVVIGGALHIFWLNHLIQDPMMRTWFIVVASLAVLGGLHRRVWSPLRNGPYRVVGVRPESPSVSTVTLAPRQGRHRPNARRAHFAPGQFGWLRFNRRAAAVDHPYSFSSSAHDASQVQVTVKRGGKFTEDLVSSRRGRAVWIDGPHGGFIPPSNAMGLVLIAAGVGITPMISILRTFADRRDRRPLRLIQSAESPEELLFDAELDQLAQVLNLEITQVVTRPHPEWRGVTGHIDVTLLHRVLPGPPLRALLDFLICGPPVMVKDTAAALVYSGVPTHRIHTEQFIMPSPKGHSNAKHASPVRPARPGPSARPVQRYGMGDTTPFPAVRPSFGGAQPELQPRRPTEPPVGGGFGNPVRADRDRPARGPMQRGVPGAERVRGSDDPRPRNR